MDRIYYTNASEYGPRKAVALTLEMAIEEVELAYDGTGFYILRPKGANPDPAAVAAQAPPPPEEPAPLTDVEKLALGVKAYREANEIAKEIILALMVKVSGALIAFGFFTLETVNDEGTRFVTMHRDAIVDFKQAGRNQLAAQALYDAVASAPSKAAFTWLEANGGAILGIFAADLGAS